MREWAGQFRQASGSLEGAGLGVRKKSRRCRPRGPRNPKETPGGQRSIRHRDGASGKISRVRATGSRQCRTPPIRPSAEASRASAREDATDALSVVAGAVPTMPSHSWWQSGSLTTTSHRSGTIIVLGKAGAVEGRTAEERLRDELSMG